MQTGIIPVVILVLGLWTLLNTVATRTLARMITSWVNSERLLRMTADQLLANRISKVEEELDR